METNVKHAMKLDEKALEAGARKEAEIDALGRADKKRYIDRLSDAICAYIEAATPHDVAGVDDMLDRFERAAFAATANLPRGKEARARESKSRSLEYNAARDAIATALRLSAGGGHDSQAVRDVLAERRRQIEAEGWTSENDDAYKDACPGEVSEQYCRDYADATIRAYLEAAMPPDVARIAENIDALLGLKNPIPPIPHLARGLLEDAATALRLSAGGGVPEGWYCSAGEHHTLLYTLRQDGWRKGKPVMVNDVTIRIENANGSQTPIEPIVRLIMDALTASPTVEAGHVE